MNNEAIASILSALTGNNNVAQLTTSFLGALNINQSAQPQVNSTTETVKNLTAITERCMSHAIIGPYMTDDQKNTVNYMVGAVNYLGDSLTYQQADKIIKDLNNILNGVGQNVVNNLTQVLQAAGIRM